MADAFVASLVLGRWQTNCYVVGDHASGRAVLVDPGEHGATEVPTLLSRLGVEVEAILCTHGHLDHVWSVPDLANELDVPVYLHPADRWMWDSPAAAFGMPAEQATRILQVQFGLDWSPPSHRLVDLDDSQQLDIAGLTATATHTPGHTPGHMTFLVEGMAGADVVLALGQDQTAPDQVLLSGDFLFAGSIGRTDMTGGDHDAMLDSLRRHVPSWTDDVLVLSGHGPDTTVGRERATNPFVRQALGT